MLLLHILSTLVIFSFESSRVQCSASFFNTHGIERREVVAGGRCGSAGGNAACASGLCCSSTGVCGTGVEFCGAPGCQLSFGPGCDGNRSPPGKDTSTVPRPQFGSVPYGVDISHCSTPGKVALTFDDGPYTYTAELLELLKANNVKATFFVVGANGGKGQIQDPSTGYPAMIQRMYSEGHQIGSHTWSHQDLSTLTSQQRRDQIIKNEMALVDILGFFPTYFRPPYTRWSPEALADLKLLGYHVTNYDIDTRDWQGDYTYSQAVYTRVLSEHDPASSSWIAISHDIHDKTVHGFVQYMIDQARKLKYSLVTLGECLGDPPANWYRDPSTGQQFNPPKANNQPQALVVPSSSLSPAPPAQIRASTPTPTPTPTATKQSSSSFSGSQTAMSTQSSEPNFGPGTGGSSVVPVSQPARTSSTTASSTALGKPNSASVPAISSRLVLCFSLVTLGLLL